jgi:hypothetical protein
MAPWAKRRSEQRKRDAALRYYLEMESRKVGWGDSALVYDEEKDLFRLTASRFAFSGEYADWELLRKRGEDEGALRIPHSALASLVSKHTPSVRTSPIWARKRSLILGMCSGPPRY